MPIKPEVFRFLVAVFEAGPLTHTVVDMKSSNPEFDLDVMFSMAYEPAGYSMSYPVDHGEYAEVHELEPGKFSYFDAGWYPIDPQELKQYRYRMGWLPKALKSGLHLSGKMTEIIPEKLWRLGDFRFMDRVMPIWLVRRLSQGEVIDEVYDALAALEQDRGGLIICHRRPQSKRFTFPGDYQLVDSVSLLNDQGYLSTESLAVYIQPKNQREDTLVYWDENRGLLYLRGKEPIQFTGTMNRRAIGLLYERCLETENKWNSQALLEEIGSNSTHISKLFRGHPQWREVVGYADGMCWLILPA